MASYEITGKVWRYPGKGGWHFTRSPPSSPTSFRVRYADAHRPFGSLQVTASLGSSTWSTSLFTDASSESYLLPIKAAIRRSEQIEDGNTATVVIELDD